MNFNISNVTFYLNLKIMYTFYIYVHYNYVHVIVNVGFLLLL